MPDLFYKLLFLILAYLLGSIPTGFLIGKAKGVDIRNHGSNNIGATNTARLLGKKYFILVAVLDAFKGFIFVFLFRYNYLPSEWCLLSPMLYGIASTLGHVFPIFLKFKGGKAVSTGAGAALGYCPQICLLGIIVFIIILLLTKFVSLGSICGALTICIGSIIASLVKNELTDNLFTTPIDQKWPLNLWYVIGVMIIVTIIIIKHKTNINRLKNKTENKF